MMVCKSDKKKKKKYAFSFQFIIKCNYLYSYLVLAVFIKFSINPEFIKLQEILANDLYLGGGEHQFIKN
jgi:hypothetical protein